MRYRHSFIAAAIIGIALAASGCGPDEPSAAEFQATFSSVTEEECLAICERVELALDEGKAASLSDVIDYEGFARIVLDLNRLGGSEREAARKEYGATEPAEFEHVELLEAIQRGIQENVTQLDRLGIQRQSDRVVAVYRLLSSDGSNYVEFMFRRADDGRVKIVDAGMLWAGCRLSDARLGPADEALVRRPDLSAEIENRLASDQAEFYRTLDDAPTIERLDETAERLDPLLRGSKFVILEQLDVATTEGERELRLIDRLVETYPDEPFSELRSFAVYYRAGRYEDGLKQLERLDEAVGGDPSLKKFRASALLALGRLEEAKGAAVAAIQFDRMDVTPYLTLISACTREGSREEALNWVETLAERDDVSPSDLVAIFVNEDLAELATTDEWRDRFDRSGIPLTEEERTELALRIEAAIVSGDASARSGLLDVEGASRRIVAMTTDDPVEQARRRRMVEKMLDKTSILDAIARGQARSGDAGGSYRLLRVHELDGRTIAVFRALGENERLTYYEYELVRAADGRPQIVDVLNYSVGETFADGMARAVRLGFELSAEMDESKDPAMHPALNAHERAIAASVGGDDETFQRAFAEMPESMRSANVFVFASAYAAQHEIDEFARRVALVEARFPGHPATGLLRLQRYARQERWEEALEAADSLDRRVGGDPYLDSLRADYLHVLDRDEEARERATAAVETEPTLAAAQRTLLTLAVRRGDTGEALERLERLVEITGQRQLAVLEAALAGDEAAQKAFLASPEGRRLEAATPEGP